MIEFLLFGVGGSDSVEDFCYLFEGGTSGISGVDLVFSFEDFVTEGDGFIVFLLFDENGGFVVDVTGGGLDLIDRYSY